MECAANPAPSSVSEQDPVLSRLLAVIEQDNAAQLQRYLCGHDPDSVCVEDEGLWERRWPQLVRHACEHVSEKSLHLLMRLKPLTGTPWPLPPLTLGWLLKGCEGHSTVKTVSNLSPGLREDLFARLSKSPITLRTADGMRLVRMGGPIAALSEDPVHGLFEAPTFQVAWQKWCASPTHRTQALPVLNALQFFTTRLSTMQEIVEHLPAATRASYLHDLCELLDKKGNTRGTSDPSPRLMMLGWQGQFVRAGWALDHPLWKSWGNRLCSALEMALPVASTRTFSTPASDWTKATLVEKATPLKEPLPGWRWTPTMREGLVRQRAHFVSEVFSSHEKGHPITVQEFERLGLFLQQTLQTETLMQRWGLGDTSTQRHLDVLLKGVLGQDWENRLDQVLQVYRDRPRPVDAHWAAWKGRRLNLGLDAATPAAGPRPRM